jgi:hypothetical protein
MYPHLRVGVVLVGLLLTSIVPRALKAETPGDQSEVHPKRPAWYERNGTQRVIGVGYLADSDSLHGFQLGYGFRGPSDEFDAWAMLWASRVSNGDQAVIGLRGDMVPLLYSTRRVAIGPLISVGLEHRELGPDAGVGGCIGFGASLMLWTPVHWQFIFGAERAFGISSQTRNQANVAAGYGW